MNELNSLTLNEKTYDRFAGNLPKPATAKVGQVLVVAAVDDDGNVTEVEAVDHSGGGGGDGSPFVVGLEINAGGSVSVTSEKWYDYMLFNGVRLPRIPADALAKYPYAWIQKNTVNGYYVLLLAPVKWYFANSVLDADCDSGGWYRLPISGAGEATAWEYYASISSGNYFSVDSDCPVLWANHDIPNGSATATEIYFAGSEPVPTD